MQITRTIPDTCTHWRDAELCSTKSASIATTRTPTSRWITRTTRLTIPTAFTTAATTTTAKNNIPVIFYFTGVHEDYHKPGDDWDKIMYPKMAEIGKLVFQRHGTWPTWITASWWTKSMIFRATAEAVELILEESAFNNVTLPCGGTVESSVNHRV